MPKNDESALREFHRYWNKLSAKEGHANPSPWQAYQAGFKRARDIYLNLDKSEPSDDSRAPRSGENC